MVDKKPARVTRGLDLVESEPEQFQLFWERMRFVFLVYYPRLQVCLLSDPWYFVFFFSCFLRCFIRDDGRSQRGENAVAHAATSRISFVWVHTRTHPPPLP